MSYIPIPNPLPVELKVRENQDSIQDTLLLILQELRIISFYAFELPRQLNSGIDSYHEDEPEKLRQEEFNHVTNI